MSDGARKGKGAYMQLRMRRKPDLLLAASAADPEGWWSGWRLRETPGNVSVRAFSKCMALPDQGSQQRCLQCAQAVKVSPLEQLLNAMKDGTRVDACAECFGMADPTV